MIHSYMNSIGFSKIDCLNDLNDVIKKIINDPDNVSKIDYNNTTYSEYHKNFTDSTGIAVLGYYKDEIENFENFVLETYFPYVESSDNAILEATDITIERFADKYSYLAMFDSSIMNMILIFFISNLRMLGKVGFVSKISLPKCDINVSALAFEGIVLLPIIKDQRSEEKKAYNDKKAVLIERAKKGDEEAIETLTLEDFETQQMLYTRTQSEDVLSIVDTYFMPEGLENDKYSIMGDIVSVKKEKNCITEEEIYLLDIFSNDVYLSVSINKKNLMGEPLVNRRFRGRVWLQGIIKLP